MPGERPLAVLTGHFNPYSPEAKDIQRAFLSGLPVWIAYPPLDIEWSRWTVLGIKVVDKWPWGPMSREFVAELKPCARDGDD